MSCVIYMMIMIGLWCGYLFKGVLEQDGRFIQK